jgi:hypothetical protein
MLDAGYLTLDAGYLTLNAGYLTLNVGYLALDMPDVRNLGINFYELKEMSEISKLIFMN